MYCPQPTDQRTQSNIEDVAENPHHHPRTDPLGVCYPIHFLKATRFDSDLPAPLVESLPTTSQAPEAEPLATFDAPALSMSECVSRSAAVKTLTLAVPELQHRS